MTRPIESSSWLPLGSALVVDWKHLGRPASARGATAWIAHLDGDPVLLRAWGEETTSYFDFVFLTDERLSGTIVVACARSDGGRLRVKVGLEIEGHLAYNDTNDFKEHPRTMLLSSSNRTLEIKVGNFSNGGPPRLSAACAEIFEIAPDGALVTQCGDWVASVLGMARDVVQGRETQQPQPRARTEHMGMRPPARETLDAPREREREQPRRAAPITDGRQRDGATPASLPATPAVEAAAPATPARAGKAAKDGALQKLTCTTNTGESFEINSDETYVGRSKQCAIVLKSQRVSRKHACVTKEADGYYINDLGAANGIWQGSEKIDREKIETGDEYIVGDIVLSFTYA